MKLRFALLAVPAALALAACGSSGGSADNTSSAPPQTSSSSSAPAVTTSSAAAAANPYCAKVADFPTKLSGFQAELAAPDASKLKDEVSQAVTYFKGLEAGAPADVAPSLQTIVSSLSGVSSINDVPALAGKLTPPITTLSTWIGTNCAAS